MSSSHSVLLVVAMALWGILSGMTNEHTGPATLFAVCAAMLWMWWRQHRVPVWIVSGTVGLLFGFLLLFFAPGQQHRYGGLAQEAGLLQRVADKGVSGTFALLGVPRRVSR